MQSFQRILAFLAIAFAPTLFIGCGGPGQPISGSSDPAAEAADAALAPEGAGEDTGDSAAESEGSSEVADAEPEESKEAAAAPEEEKASE